MTNIVVAATTALLLLLPPLVQIRRCVWCQPCTTDDGAACRKDEPCEYDRMLEGLHIFGGMVELDLRHRVYRIFLPCHH